MPSRKKPPAFGTLSVIFYLFDSGDLCGFFCGREIGEKV